MGRYVFLWGMYGLMAAAFGALMLIIPSEPTGVFYAAVIGTGLLFAIAGIAAALRFWRERGRSGAGQWPDVFSVLAISLFVFAFLDSLSVRCSVNAAIAIESVNGIIMILTALGSKRLEKIGRWMLRHWKPLLSVAAATLVLTVSLRLGIPFVRYRLAVSAMQKGDYAQAADRFAAHKDYLDSERLYRESRYRLGVQLFEQGDALQAYGVLSEMTENSDAQACIDEHAELMQLRQKFADYNIGCTLSMGTFNGVPLEWRVLAQRENRRLLIAADVIRNSDYKPEGSRIVSWETCPLREWLNSEFLSDSFSEAEQRMIVETEVENADNWEWRTKAGNDTVDFVFLLSDAEARMYFADDADRAASTWWWLRSPGCSLITAEMVFHYGQISTLGNYVDVKEGGIRPAMWIDLEQLPEK